MADNKNNEDRKRNNLGNEVIGKKTKGIIYIVTAAFFFALMGLFIALAGKLPPVQKSFFRNIISVIVAFILVAKSNFKPDIDKLGYRDLILRATFGTIGILCNFYALDNLPLSDASMLNKMSPFFTILFSYIILKEKLTITQVILVFCAFLGSLFVIKPTLSNIDLGASLIGLLGGMFAGAAYTMVRKLGEENISGTFVVLFFSSFSCLVTLPFIIFDYHPMSLKQLIALLLAGICASCAQFSITKAYFSAPAKEIAVYDYSQIIFSALLGYTVFKQTPDIYSIIGYIIIISMAIVMYKYNNNINKNINR